MISPTGAEAQLQGLITDWIESGRPKLEGLGMSSESSLSCPAASDLHGSTVFAVFDEVAGEMWYMQEPIDVPVVLREKLNLDVFTVKNRLAGPCLTSSCQHWQEACRLGHFVSKIDISARSTSPNCAIQDACRWRKENGSAVCNACAFVRNLLVDGTATR